MFYKIIAIICLTGIPATHSTEIEAQKLGVNAIFGYHSWAVIVSLKYLEAGKRFKAYIEFLSTRINLDVKC